MSGTINKRAARTATVTIRRSEYERLLAKAGESVAGFGPAFSNPDSQGNFPAVAYLRASIARELIRRRIGVGLSQSELGSLAGVRQETISRIESARVVVSERVMTRIEDVLRRRESSKARRGAGKRVARRTAA